MLRRVLSLGLVLGWMIAATPAVAQEIAVGAKGGVNIADVSTDDPELTETDARTGILGGAFLSIGLGDVFAVQPELFFTQKGTGFTDEGVDVDLKVDYFEIPLLFKAVLGAEGSLLHVAPYVGGAVAFESSCELEGSDDTVELKVDCDDPNVEFERETTDFGVLFGAEVLLKVGDRAFVLVDGRYNVGLRNLESGESSLSTKSRVFSAMAGFGIRLN